MTVRQGGLHEARRHLSPSFDGQADDGQSTSRIRGGGRTIWLEGGQGLRGCGYFRVQGQGQTPGARRDDEGGQREGVRHGRVVVGGPAWSITYGPSRHTAEPSRKKCWPVPSSAGAR